MESPRLKQLLDLLNETPNDPFLIYALAKEYEILSNDELALTYYQRLADEHANYVGTYYHLGKLLVRTEQYKTAIEIYEKGMKIAKQLNDQHAYNELAGAKLELGDDDDF